MGNVCLISQGISAHLIVESGVPYGEHRQFPSGCALLHPKETLVLGTYALHTQGEGGCMPAPRSIAQQNLLVKRQSRCEQRLTLGKEVDGIDRQFR